MTSPYFSPSTSLLRVVCFVICYSFVLPFFALPLPGAVIASAGSSTTPVEMKTPRKASHATQKREWRDGELLVRFRKNLSTTEIDGVLQANGAERAGRLRGQSGVERLRLLAGSDATAVAATLRASKMVDFAEPNYLITADQTAPDDPRLAEQWALRNDGTAGGHFGSDINISRGWELATGSTQTVIAVLDSGVDFTHPELLNNGWDNTLERANGTDDDKNGFSDDLHGWDFVTNTGEISDGQGHGTAVAGIIAAQGNNATGITGVMWRAGLMSLRVLDNNGTGDVASAAEAIDYAVTNGAQVINCSWGTNDASTVLLEAIRWASKRGVIVVASAGNESRDIETAPRYPASFDLDNLISVASTDKSDLLAAWSNRGAKHVTIAAPGTDILTTKAGGDYQTISGSSASAPFVTGVAGLIKTLRPWLTAERTRAMIIRGARQASSLSGKVSSGGIVNAAGSLHELNLLPPDEGRDNSNGNNSGKHGKPEPRTNARGNEGGAAGRDASEFMVTPPKRTLGTPGPNLPNLDELQGKQPTKPKAKPPIPSDRCAHRNPRCQGNQKLKGAAQPTSLSPERMLAQNFEMPDVGLLLKNVSGMVSDSSRPLAIFANAPAMLSPSEPSPTVEKVVWTNAVGVSVTDNNLTKTAGTGWIAGAVSTRSISYGDGYVEFTVAETNKSRVVGLSKGDTNQSYTDITFGFNLNSSGTIYIHENGTSRGTFGTYATGDRMRVAVESGVVKYYQNGTLIYTSTLTPAYPLLVDTALYTVASTITDVIIKGVLQGPEDVVWTNVVGATASGNDLTKTAGTAWGNSGAVSTRSISSGDGYVEFTVAEINTARMMGLSNGDTTQNYTDINFAFYAHQSGTIYVYENGVSRGSFGLYAVGDKLRVAVEGGVVKYYLNTTLLYTSTVAPTYPLLVDTALNTIGADITDAVLNGSLQGTLPSQDVFWTNVVGADASGNNLTKTTTTLWGNSGAVSIQTIPYGDGYVEFTVSEANTSRVLGLSKGDTTQSHTDVTFGFNLHYSGTLYIIENGTSRGIFGTYATGDRMRVATESGVVKYYQNGTLVYTSTLTPAYPMLVDTALYSAGATITDVNIWWDPESDPSGNNYAPSRLDPMNRTGQPGVDMLSRNINWSLPLLGLPGRAGLDLGLSLTYNSLVWTKSGTTIRFDADEGTPSPGFRLGFPVIEPSYYNSQVGANAYLMIMPSGSRVELRQVGTSNVYESADSSYLDLTANGNGTLLVRDTSGTQYSYSLINGQYRCTQVKDSNGNFITTTYHANGSINTITDTLARTLNFNYDGFENLISITQTWAGDPEPHAWATFGWTTVKINTSFTNLTLVGPQNSDDILMLSQMSLSDGTRYNFEYNSYGQVSTIRHYADDDHQLSYTSYTLPASTTDCPRPTQRKDWAENWTGVNGVPAEATTNYVFTVGVSGQATMPDGTIYKEFFSTTAGWQKGLTTSAGFWLGTINQKLTTVTWAQDDPALAYRLNPRVIETRISDGPNSKRMTIQYDKENTDYERWGLPYLVREYAADGVTEIRHNFTDYNLDPAYIGRHIIGLVSARHTSNTLVWQSVVHFAYDAGGTQLVATSPATIQHDTSYSTALTARGNLTSISRYDATDLENVAKRSVTQIGYNTNGSILFTKDPLNRQTTISYLDSFSDGINTRNTHAYPTKVTPPTVTGETAANFASTTQYSYDFGAATRTQGPIPAGQTQGAIQTMQYDAAGRISRIDHLANTAYRRWVYATSGSITIYWKNDTGATESNSTAVFDGAGRVRATSGNNPASVGGYSGQYTYYDVMGRVLKNSNPTEMTSAWVPAGDDATAGWVWTQQTYDWKGRPRITTNPDGTIQDVTYGGCGCAGGEVVTVKDEMSRRRKITSDVLGRPWKTEVLNSNLTVYSTKTNTYNSLDRITEVIERIGSSGTSQSTTTEYDGHGRVWKTKNPEATAPTVVTYLASDEIDKVTDARGAVTDFTYNVRGQTTNLSYTAPAGIAATASAAYGYDAAGNRLWMTDELGRVDYQYDALSQLISENRDFNAVTNPTSADGKFKLTYTYTWSGTMKSITDPFGERVDYAFDSLGRTTGVTGTAFAGFTQYSSLMKYRAWGGAKSINYGDGLKLDLSYNERLKPSQYDFKDAAGVRLMGAAYDYYNDGRLRFVDDLREDRFDRLYDYDHVGRATKAETGYKARGAAYPGDNSQNGPYNHYYGYDEFNHLVSRTGSYWYRESGETYTATYANNRNLNAGWVYDADGRVTQSQTTGSSPSYPYTQTYTSTYTYDAAGRRTDVGKYDGDGKLLRPANGMLYYIRSSVINGLSVSEVHSELKAAPLPGTKSSTFVYLGNEAIAEQHVSSITGSIGQEQMKWRRTDPAKTSVHIHDDWSLPASTGGKVQMATDLQGISTEVPDYASLQQDPAYYNQSYGSYNYGAYGYGPGGGYSSGYGGGGVPGNFGSGCMLMGVATPCDFVMQLVNAGAAAVDYVVHDRNGLRHEQIPVVSLSLGLYVVGSPVVRTDEEGPYFDIQEDVHLSHATQQPGSFQDCFQTSGLANTHVKGLYADAKLFNEEVAGLLLDIKNAEGVSATLLAVTLMNENTKFNLKLEPNTNGKSSDNIERWDVGPFQLNVYWTNKAIAIGEVSSAGLSMFYGVYGPFVTRSDGITPAPFSGSPLQNGRMAARRLSVAGGNDRQRAVNYTAPESREERGKSYDAFAPLFDKFFNCYKPQ